MTREYVQTCLPLTMCTALKRTILVGAKPPVVRAHLERHKGLLT